MCLHLWLFKVTCVTCEICAQGGVFQSPSGTEVHAGCVQCRGELRVSSTSASHLQAPNSRSLDPVLIFLSAVIKRSDQKQLEEARAYLCYSLSSRDVKSRNSRQEPGDRNCVWRMLTLQLAHRLTPSWLSGSAHLGMMPPLEGCALLNQLITSHRFIVPSDPGSSSIDSRLCQADKAEQEGPPTPWGIPRVPSNRYTVAPSS